MASHLALLWQSDAVLMMDELGPAPGLHKSVAMALAIKPKKIAKTNIIAGPFDGQGWPFEV